MLAVGTLPETSLNVYVQFHSVYVARLADQDNELCRDRFSEIKIGIALILRDDWCIFIPGQSGLRNRFSFR